MNENEKNLFYHVLKDKAANEPAPPPDFTSIIMHSVHNYAKKRVIMHKTLEILGYSFLGFFSFAFVGIYLFFFTNFQLPVFRFHIEMPSIIYIVFFSIIFVFSLIELYFRRKLYEN